MYFRDTVVVQLNVFTMLASRATGGRAARRSALRRLTITCQSNSYIQHFGGFSSIPQEVLFLLPPPPPRTTPLLVVDLLSLVGGGVV